MDDNPMPKVWRRPSLPDAYQSKMRKYGAHLTLLSFAFVGIFLLFEGAIFQVLPSIFVVAMVSSLTEIVSVVIFPAVIMWVGGIVVDEIRRNAFENFLRGHGIDPEHYTGAEE